MIHFEIPKNQSSIIKVIGVGGGGSNAVNYMYSLGIDGVDFIVCNTDSQALTQSPIPNKIQLGPHLTQGLGAGANPEIGKQAGKESIEEIEKILKVNTRMAFITAGMGGGTGTGAAPIISEVCKKLGILTVGIVTTPFAYEGRKRLKQAQDGITTMRQNVDTILIISNDKLRQQFGNLPFTQAFAKADNVLATAAKCITDLITVDGKVNLDFNDVQTVMKSGGVAILGSAVSSGENRAQKAVEEALSSPLLNDSEIEGAKWILLNVTSASGEYEHTLDELEIIQGFVQSQAGNTCDIILGMGHNPDLGEHLAVTIIATGFQQKAIGGDHLNQKQAEPEKVVVALGQKNADQIINNPVQNEVSNNDPYAPKLVDNQSSTITGQVTQPSMFAQPAKVQIDNFSYAGYTQKSNEVKENSFPLFEEKKEIVQESAVNLELIIKTEPAPQYSEVPSVPPTPIKVGERVLSQEEIEERNRFEEQKRALEERAERLRKMSFNISGTDSPEVIENIPAYQRREIKLDHNHLSNSDNLSGYTVSNDENGPQINTVNTFLAGNKPD